MKFWTKKLLSVLIITITAIALLPGAGFALAQHEKRIIQAVSLLKEMEGKQDTKTMARTIKSAKGIAIFPAVTEAALGLGGLGGEGIVLIRNPKGGWYGPSYASISGGSIGFQIGVKKVGLVLAITNNDGLQAFTGGNSFKLGADVSIAAGPVGRDAEAATDSRAQASIYSYSISKGLFAGVSLKGSVINVNRDANKAYWQKPIEAKEALSKPADKQKIKPLVNELNKISKMAR